MKGNLWKQSLPYRVLNVQYFIPSSCSFNYQKPCIQFTKVFGTDHLTSHLWLVFNNGLSLCCYSGLSHPCTHTSPFSFLTQTIKFTHSVGSSTLFITPSHFTFIIYFPIRWTLFRCILVAICFTRVCVLLFACSSASALAWQISWHQLN